MNKLWYTHNRIWRAIKTDEPWLWAIGKNHKHRKKWENAKQTRNLSKAEKNTNRY